MRISVELWDAYTGADLWDKKTECMPSELFEVPNRIVGRVVAGIAPNAHGAELRTAMTKKPENFTAYDHTLRALHMIHSLDKATFMQARDYLQKAIEEDPSFAMPVAWLARWHSLNLGQGWSSDPDSDRGAAARLAVKAIELDGQNALALATYGHLKAFLFHDYDSALTYFDRALAACPNSSLVWMLSVSTLSYVGQTEKAIEHAHKALALSPMDSSLYSYYSSLSIAYYAHGSFEEAVKWGKMSASENPLYTANMRYLAAALAALGRLHEAREVAARLLRQEPGFRLSTYRAGLQPFRDPAGGARYMKHLEEAGLPE